MSPKKPDVDPSQGALFQEVTSGSGATDPIVRRLDAVPDGVFPEPEKPADDFAKNFADEEIARSVHEAVVTDRRRAGQLGKHSPLQRDGNYSGVKPGDVLPGFGIVTHRNLRGAQDYAAGLDADRNRK